MEEFLEYVLQLEESKKKKLIIGIINLKLPVASITLVLKSHLLKFSSCNKLSDFHQIYHEECSYVYLYETSTAEKTFVLLSKMFHE